ncbi:TonB-dependent receptor [Gilvimarinus sp. SDUM040013]|uniref:TonB-dependent receptor n=1 Tax=Gilvimarinus gilvus TaxID=3058038 RepID=A0ABU4S119_9GAMM|nr:TonB-dependent receptor [Gilvimarinus sp. SDUM040013]MDO3387640.1 TonB-dependent receptor [Gilvimarinus sp. SDUM040013]MDX6848919.1 TonB-dependent receptor [Gilvimarinus sp. SDUM040013]
MPRLAARTKFSIFATLPLAFCSTVNAESSDKNMEEMLVVSTSREGDYTIITQNTEKLIDTAGAMGDPLSAIYALPGVVYSQGQEPAVRGSSPSDNQFTVDFMPASYIFHEFGVSIFSEFILHDFQMYSAGFGPEYSNATGAVFDITLREPKNQPLSATIDFSMLRSGVFIEGGITDNSAFYLSYRKSLLDLFLKEDDLSDEDDGIVFTDVPRDTDYQFKYQWNINNHNSLIVSANGAGDDAEAKLTEKMYLVATNPDFYGNAKLDESYSGQNVIWTHRGDSGLEFTLGYGLLDDESGTYWGNQYSELYQAEQATTKARLYVPLSDSFALEFGSQLADIDFSYTLDSILFVCTEFDPSCDETRSEPLNFSTNNQRKETSHYLNSSWSPGANLRLDIGAQYQYNDYTDEDFLLPRVAVTWDVTESTTLSAKAGQYNRFPDIDTVLPETGNPDLKSPTADHYTLGIEQHFDDGWSYSLEGYYKTLHELPKGHTDDSPYAALRYTNDIEGEAYGVDFMINKDLTDKWWGWFSLSYGKSERTDLIENETREYYLDTPIIANWVLNYQFRHNMNIGWRWSARSGQAYTPIVGVQDNPWFEGHVLPVYGDAFSERLPHYNRLDVRFSWQTTAFGKDAELMIDIINLLDYNNISERNLDYKKVTSTNDEVATVDEAEIGLMPAVTFRVSF